MKTALEIDDENSRLKIAVIVAAVAIAAGVAFYVFSHGLNRDAVTLATRAESAASGSQTSMGQSPEVPMVAEAHAPASDANAGETRAQELARWVASGKPEGAQAAFRAIEACVAAKRLEALIAAETQEVVKAVYRRNFTPAVQACEGITGGQVTQRLPLAIKAAEAGLPGSYLDLWALGAQDEFIQNDAAYVAAFPAIRDAAVERADKDALMGRFQFLSNCSDPPRCNNVDLPQALTLWTAYVEVGGLKQRQDTVTAQLSGKMTLEQSAAAIAAGHALVTTAKGAK